MPSSLCSEPPGPAIPVIDKVKLAIEFSKDPMAISIATCSLTAPNDLNVVCFTLSISIFASFE